MATGERNKITAEGFLEEYLVKIIESGDIETIGKLLEKFHDPKAFKRVLDLTDSLKSPKNVVAVRELLAKKAEGIIFTLKKEQENGNLKEGVITSLQALETTVINFKTTTIEIKAREAAKAANSKAKNSENKKGEKSDSLEDQFFSAIENGKSDLVKDLINKNPKLIESKNKNGQSALDLANSKGDKTMIDLLESRGAKSAAANAESDRKGSNNSSNSTFDSESSPLRPSLSGVKAKTGKPEISAIGRNQERIEAQQQAIFREAQKAKDIKEIMEMFAREAEIAHKAALARKAANKEYSIFGQPTSTSSTEAPVAGAENNPDLQTDSMADSMAKDESKISPTLAEMILKGADLKNLSKSSLTEELFKALREGNSLAFLALLEKGGINLNDCVSNGESLLEAANKSGNIFISSALVAKGANLKLEDIGKKTDRNLEKADIAEKSQANSTFKTESVHEEKSKSLISEIPPSNVYGAKAEKLHYSEVKSAEHN